jgi:hypothetical protein
MTTALLIEACIAELGCDTARVSEAGGKLFLVAGSNRRSECEWEANGEPVSFDYVEEHTVASGRTAAEVLASLAEFKRISGLTTEEYLLERMAALEGEKP